VVRKFELLTIVTKGASRHGRQQPEAISLRPLFARGAMDVAAVWARLHFRRGHRHHRGLGGLRPCFNYSDTWQLIINTGTTIITFLMVFLIQNTQNRDTTAIQLKLDELIRANEYAQNRMMKLEDLTENQIKHLKESLAAPAPIEAIRQPLEAAQKGLAGAAEDIETAKSRLP
jgi:low affinity Fe/Cu permease